MRARAALALALTLASAGPLAAQHLEPPRRPGIGLPAEHQGPFGPPGAALVREAPPSPLARAMAAGRAVSGRMPLLLIPALFADSPEPHVDPADLQRVLFDGPAPEGTLPEFYHEASGGLLLVDGVVLPWVRTEVSLAEAAGDRDGHGWIGPRMRDYVKSAVQAADPLVDYGQFDNDGPDGIPNSGDDDGLVDGLSIEFLEVAGSCGGPAPWPHLWTVSGEDGGPFPTADLRPDGTPIGVRLYIAEGVTDCTGVELQGVGVVAHELGHVLGLPDLYRAVEGIRPEQRHWVVGCFDIMGAGSWGCGSGVPPDRFGPSGLSPLMKGHLGWLSLEPVGRVLDHELVLEPVSTSKRAFSLPLGPGSEETLIVEYRPRSGFDVWLPAGGVLLYHRDTAASTRLATPGSPPPYPYHLMEADGDWELRRVEAQGGNRGEAADVFTSDAALGFPWSPGLLHDGTPSTLTVHALGIEGGRAHLRISTVAAPAVIAADVPPAQALESYEARLRVAGGALPYRLPEAGLLGGLNAELQGDEVIVSGVPLRAGTLAGELIIEDARGYRISYPVTLHVADLTLAEDRLLGPLLANGEDLAAAEREYLDASGNANGRYDVGDLRAYLLRR